VTFRRIGIVGVEAGGDADVVAMVM
jgi:hypothetical protein